ncbi:MAG TPA: SPOR domain-containing protein [Terracidiphilus sp.]|nr:SPOR domain-containing protein [Terracidiphilus sp.]
MRGAFDDDFEQEPGQLQRDTEWTLGSGALVAIFGGLVILCGLCFGLGYTLGHRSSQAPAATAPTAEVASQPASGGSLTKPSATEGAAQSATVQAASADPATTAAPGLTPAGDAQTVPASAPVAASANQAEIHPALTPAVETTQSTQSAAASPVRPAFTAANASPAGAFMVQIAAVSNAEDAGVLTNALRKRGYTVTSRREPADNLIHVRIGPFATPAEANTWKMKLLNDGYNAIVQP